MISANYFDESLYTEQHGRRRTYVTLPAAPLRISFFLNHENASYTPEIFPFFNSLECSLFIQSLAMCALQNDVVIFTVPAPCKGGGTVGFQVVRPCAQLTSHINLSEPLHLLHCCLCPFRGANSVYRYPVTLK